MHPSCIEPEKLYATDPELKFEDVGIIQEWLKKESHLPELQETQVLLFLHSCYYSVQAAKVTIDNYFTRRTQHPDIFKIVEEEKLQSFYKTISVIGLPKRTPQNYNIYFLKLVDTNVDRFNFMQGINVVNAVSSFHQHHYGPGSGIIAVFDLKGFTLSHLARFNWVVMKHELDHIQEGLPLRIKGVHFINPAPFMDKILALCRPFLDEKLYNMIQIHNSFETFYKYVPKECLPEEHGGDLPSIPSLNDEYRRTLVDNMDFFSWHDSQKVDESLRRDQLEGRNNVFGVEGTFKKLALD